MVLADAPLSECHTPRVKAEQGLVANYWCTRVRVNICVIPTRPGCALGQVQRECDHEEPRGLRLLQGREMKATGTICTEKDIMVIK